MTVDLEKQLDDIEAKIKALRGEKSELVSQQLTKMKKGPIIDIIKDIRWCFNVRYRASVRTPIRIISIGPIEGDRSKFEDVLTMSGCRMYHFQEEFYSGRAWIMADDGEYQLRFKDSDTLFQFIVEHKLTVDLSEITDTISEHETEINNLNVARQSFEKAMGNA